MNRKIIALLILLALPVLVAAQITLPGPASGVDPCTTNSKLVIPVNIVSATTTQLLALSAGKAIYICSATLTIAGSATTAGSILFEYGTGASCGTGTTAITGAMVGSTTAGNPTVIPFQGGSGTQFGTIAGQALCAVSAGTTVSIQGYITVVQF
jgi:hypothetical protein